MQRVRQSGRGSEITGYLAVTSHCIGQPLRAPLSRLCRICALADSSTAPSRVRLEEPAGSHAPHTTFSLFVKSLEIVDLFSLQSPFGCFQSFQQLRPARRR